MLSLVHTSTVQQSVTRTCDIASQIINFWKECCSGYVWFWSERLFSLLNGDNVQCLLNKNLLKECCSEYVCYDLKGASYKAIIMYRFYKTLWLKTFFKTKYFCRWNLKLLWMEGKIIQLKKCLSSLPTCSAASPGGTQAYSSKAQPLSSSLGKPE